MTIPFGWSLDFTGPRRLAVALLAAFAVAILGQAVFVAPASAASYNPATDPNSMAGITKGVGAQDWWRQGFTGRGVDIALIDTGCSPVKGLNAPGKIVHGPDLSLESQASNLRNLDTNGHGTHMAGIIAGNDAKSGAANLSASVYRGMAPDARLVCIKVATADGGTDVSQVIAAIDWVVTHQHDNGMNIRIINLSYGTNSTQAYTADPLAYAAEQAWRHGIFVVAAAGNSGYQQGKGATGLASPAYDTFVMAVGATERRSSTAVKGSVTTRESIASFSVHGPGCFGCRNPDLVAPGAHIQGLRVPGSFVDLSSPPGLLTARFQRGSGTSEATAIVSGAAALILQRYPTLSVDQLKVFLQAGTVKVAGANSASQGAGRLNLTSLLTRTPFAAVQWFEPSTGKGLLETSRGNDHVSRNGVVLRGEQDIFGHAFDSAELGALQANGSAWTGGTWNGNAWSGSGWSGATASGNSWSGNSWSGNSWSGNSWSGNSWCGNSWSGNSWSGHSWTGSSWSGNSWSGSSWSGDVWASAGWY